MQHDSQTDRELNTDSEAVMLHEPEPVHFTSGKKKQFRSMILSTLAILIILFAGIKLIRLIPESTVQKKKPYSQLSLSINPGHSSVLNKTNESNFSKVPDLEPVTNAAQKKYVFPPVYHYENISRPDLTFKLKSFETNPLEEKFILQTEGPANISFFKNEKEIKMTLLDGEVKELIIDGVLIDPGSYFDYDDLIKTGISVENESKKQEEQTGFSTLNREKKRQNELVINSIIKSLARDQLVSDQESIDFLLQWNKLIIHGIVQNKELYEKYKALYEESSGKKINPLSTIYITR